jgi:hypothetical protein
LKKTKWGVEKKNLYFILSSTGRLLKSADSRYILINHQYTINKPIYPGGLRMAENNQIYWSSGEMTLESAISVAIVTA